MKRRLPKGTDLYYAERVVEYGLTSKSPKELQHRWISQEKRRTHKRERREGRRAVEEDR